MKRAVTWIRRRLREPSSLAGLGLIFSGVSVAISTGGAEPHAWCSIFGGIGALLMPEAGGPPGGA